MRRVLTNFLSANRVRTREKDVEEQHSDEQLSDEDCVLEDADLEHVLVTKPGGKSSSHTPGKDSHHENAVSALARVQDIWGEHVRLDQKRQRIQMTQVPRSFWNATEMCKAARKRIREDEVIFVSPCGILFSNVLFSSA